VVNLFDTFHASKLLGECITQDHFWF
jgi:hypothetical protein